MKRLGYFAAIAACVAASVSCQEELKTDGVGNAVPMITKTMLAEGNLWTDGNIGTKSIYNPESGITMTGNEPMDIFYGNPADAENASNENPYMKRVETSATSNGEGSFSYSFGHNQIDGADVYDYVVITPYLSNAVAALNGAGTALRFELSPVQMPDDREQRILLRAADDHPGDHMANLQAFTHRKKPPVHSRTQNPAATSPLRPDTQDGASSRNRVSSRSISY